MFTTLPSPLTVDLPPAPPQKSQAMPKLSLEGQTLGKYQILQPLGQGGMARVYRAYHPQLDRYVAVKVLRGDLVEEPEFLARFQREARSVAALRHPNIVQVFDFDTQDDVSYMVMELLEGDTLKARLNDYRARNQSLPVGEVARVLLDVLAGLTYAHSEGMIHRDLKPANVLLTRRGQAVITDFGIAQIIGGTRHTVSGALMGTLNYMAPEQGLENKCDARSDLYSLGILLYELFTGQPPFDADTPLAILMKHAHDPLLLPRSAHVPPAFERVILKAVSKDPADRYQTAEAMAAALHQAATEAGVSVPNALTLPEQPPATATPAPVFSGTARFEQSNAAAMAQFANDQTDVTFGAALGGGAAASAAANPAQANAPAADSAAKQPPSSGVRLAGMAFPFIIAFPILLAIPCAGITGHWEIVTQGWPAILFLVGLAFSLLLGATHAAGMLVVTSTLAAVGLLLSYYSLTDRWGDWYLWLLLPAAMFPFIWLAPVLQHGRWTKWGTRFFAVLGIVFFTVAALGVPLLAFLRTQ